MQRGGYDVQGEGWIPRYDVLEGTLSCDLSHDAFDFATPPQVDRMTDGQMAVKTLPFQTFVSVRKNVDYAIVSVITIVT